MVLGSDRLWQAVEVGDPHFDEWVFCGVKTTGDLLPIRAPDRRSGVLDELAGLSRIPIRSTAALRTSSAEREQWPTAGDAFELVKAPILKCEWAAHHRPEYGP